MNPQLLPLISAIYSAASSPEEWPEVAQTIQRVIGGHSVHLAMSDPTKRRVDCIFSNGLSHDETAWYNKHVAHQDELTGVFNQRQPGTAFLLQDCFSQEQLHQLACYEEFYDKVGLNDFAASYFFQDQATHGWCTVARSKQDTAFSQEQRELLAVLTPHLSQAMRISLQLSAAAQASQLALDSLEMLPIGIILLSSHNTAVSYNSRASQFISKSDKVEGWQINLPCPAAQQQLLSAVKSIIKAPTLATSQCLSFNHDSQSYTAVVTPWVSSAVQQEWLPDNTCCMVMLNSSNNGNTISNDWLKQRYGISPAESRVIHQLLAGHTPTEAAEVLFVSPHTVRFHIKSLLAKTGCGSQTQMVVKVLRDFSGLY